MEQRKYALNRVRSGDYLCPSNDCQTLWRFTKYTEDGSLATMDGRVIRGQFWDVSSIPMPPSGAVDREWVDEQPWRTVETLIGTRREAIGVMERLQPPEPRGDDDPEIQEFLASFVEDYEAGKVAPG
jgi:hypothetical protein